MTDQHREHPDITHTTLSVFFLVLLAASSFWVLSPFLTSLLWATIVTVAAWPSFLRLEALVGGRRSLAVAIMTTLILLVVFVPVALAVMTVVKNADDITAQLRTLETIALPEPPSWLVRVPLGGQHAAETWSWFAALGPQERAAVVTPYLQTGLRWFAAKAGSIGAMLLQFLLTAIVSAILFAKGEVARESILRFAGRLGGQQGEDVAILAGRAMRGVVLGIVGTALIQAAIGGLGLAITGVPAAALLTAVMLFFCLAMLGPLWVLVPAVVWLYWSGANGWGTVLLAISLVDGTVDNVIRPLLIRRGADIPMLLIIAGVIGGLIAFGIVGLFIGPVLLTVTHTLCKAWVAGEQPTHAAADTVATAAR
jgi:predicted PurR-regulated permease PerM